jgi:hypothetical protein
MLPSIFKPKSEVAKYGNIVDKLRAKSDYDLDSMLAQPMPIGIFMDKMLDYIRSWPDKTISRFGLEMNIGTIQKSLELMYKIGDVPHIYAFIPHHKVELTCGSICLMWHTIMNGKRMECIIEIQQGIYDLHFVDVVTGEEHYNKYFSDPYNRRQVNIDDTVKNMKRFPPVPYQKPMYSMQLTKSILEHAILNSLQVMPRIRERTFIDGKLQVKYKQFHYNFGDVRVGVFDDGDIMFYTPYIKDNIIMPYFNKDTMMLLEELGETFNSLDIHIL